MRFIFTVARANDTTVSQVVTLNGEQITAAVPAFQIELLDSNGGAYTRSFIGSEIATAKILFIQGKTVALALEAEAAKQ